MKNKKTILAVVMIIAAILIGGIFIAFQVKTQVRELFYLNKELQEEGYYMADFEFKMMAMAYWLDHGQYYTALSRLNRLHKQLKAKEGLIKVPRFTDKESELEFYLNLQNPKTGAFMDDSYPYCTYNEPSENILVHLDALACETGRTLQLKYPLKYLDEINTPEKLLVYLDDIAKVGWIATKFPQTSFVFARSLLSYYNGEGVMGENNLYNFSPEWKAALLRWFYDNQDPQTGFWGPLSRKDGRLLKKDLTNTASVIKAFIDRKGNDLHEAFPLRYRKEMFETALEVLAEPQPADQDLEEWHEWSLKMGKGTTMLTRYLWKEASEENKSKAKALIESYVETIFEKYYVAEEGAFSYYPDSKYAALDGTGGIINQLTDYGFFSAKKQKFLWQSSGESVIDLGVHGVEVLTARDIEAIAAHPEVNSLRFYSSAPDLADLTSGVLAVSYPRKTPIRDILDFGPRVKKWLNVASQSMGNWTSKEELIQSINKLEIEEVLVFADEIPLERFKEFLKKNERLVVIGFDILQVPRYMIVYE